MATKQMTLEEVNDARESYEGFCKHCNDITTEEVEPDAENYNCPVCEQDEVFGIEQAVLLGYISIKG